MFKPCLTKYLMATTLLFVSSTGIAATSSVTATVTSVLVNGGNELTNHGGCMAALSVSPTTKISSCLPNWVTFSCNGNFTEQVQAYRLLDQAQLALAANKTVTVYFDGDKKHNGYCFAYRIDVKK